jgi:membrane-bound serine protease (ClpP class)
MALRLTLAALIALLAACCVPARAAGGPVTALAIDGPIGPASADYVVRGIHRAAQNGSELVILQIDTPGGLDTSMRMIVKAILASPVPVASHVAPGGARAASAGLYILYASHIAAMAPATNLGSATPVDIGIGADQARDRPGAGAASPMARKQVNDAAAYIRSLAQLRGRNAEWAERAVREAVSLPAQEALKLGVVEYVAADPAALLAQLDGKTVSVLGQPRRLRTGGAALLRIEPDWRSRLLGAITNPSIALLLMMVGVYGLLFELMNPGAALPGVMGAICLLFGLYALQLLPVNYAGLALILLGIAFMVAEGFVPSFGSLGLGGVVALVAGALILVDTDLPGYGIPIAFIIPLALGSALLVGGTAGIALKTRRRAVAGGAGGVIGNVGEVRHALAGEAWVHVHGETWQARSKVALAPGQQVMVIAREGLVLEVIPIRDNDKGVLP